MPAECRQCGAILEATSDKYLACPKGHGGLVTSPNASRLWRYQLLLADQWKSCKGLPRATKGAEGVWKTASWQVDGRNVSLLDDPHDRHESVRHMNRLRNSDLVKTGVAVLAVIDGPSINRRFPRIALFKLAETASRT